MPRNSKAKQRPRTPNKVSKSALISSTKATPLDQSALLALPISEFFWQLPNTRATEKHILFHHGVLSNWCLDSPPFSGHRALALCAKDVNALLPKVFEHADDRFRNFATWLLVDHQFNCGEQWMMGMKAWIFEFNSEDGLKLGKELEPSAKALETKDVDTGSKPLASNNGDVDFTIFWSSESVLLYEKLRDRLFEQELLTSSSTEPSGLPPGLVEKWQATSLVQILSTSVPKNQKSLGRSIPNFDPVLWGKYSIPSVTAACIARVEVDPLLKQVYLNSGTRRFAEGAPRDTVWGTGRGYKSDAGDDESTWRGENRLGKCHDAARDFIMSVYG